MEGGNFPSRLPSLSYGGTNGNNNIGNVSRQRPPVQEQDHYVPISNIIKIMRRILPAHAKISDGAKETIQECVSEYISFITSEANERCHQEHRRTVTAEDLLWAMGKLGFDDYIAPLSAYINRYRKVETGRSPLRSELYVKPRLEYEPPLGVPLYGTGFNYGPQPGMFGVMALGQAMGGPINVDTGGQMGGTIGGPLNGDFGGQIAAGLMGGLVGGAMGGYYGEASGAGGSSSSHPGITDFDPYAEFK